ncbi:MAG TPA: hypothetical protein DIS94_03910 [Bacteroidetes bacterium]|nr:hypothetical protein [Bacteroidota bacterium]
MGWDINLKFEIYPHTSGLLQNFLLSLCMKLILLLFLVLIISCSENKNKIFIPDLSNADKVLISYKTGFDSTSKMNVEQIEITDKNEISKIKSIISDTEYPNLFCVYNGQINFYKSDSLLQAFVFNTDPSLRHIAFNLNNKIYSVTLNEQSADKLTAYFKVK